MKKIAFVLAVLLLTAPAWASTVEITATQVPDTNQVEISYVSTGTLPRAFGLDITVTDGNIVACTAAHVGECDATDQGYGIFPGTIVIDSNGLVTDYNTPVAPSDATGALGGLGTAGITIEMGSLYTDTNSPDTSGVLCTIVVTESCTVNIAGNAARCGEVNPPLGVVMEDPEEEVLATYEPGTVVLGPIDCFDSAHADYNEWVLVGKPNSWCYIYQCYGDADGMRNGNPLAGYARVMMEDLNILIPAWKKPVGDPAENLAADFDRTLNGNPLAGYSRVMMEDLNILITNWKDDAGISADCGGDIDLTP